MKKQYAIYINSLLFLISAILLLVSNDQLIVRLLFIIISGCIISSMYLKLKQRRKDLSDLIETDNYLMEEMEKQKKQLEIHQFVMNSNNSTVFYYNVTSKEIVIAEGLQQLYGLDGQTNFAAISKMLHDRVMKEDLFTLLHQIEKLFEGNAIQTEYRVLASDNKVKWHLLHADPLMDVNKKATGLVGSIIDVTAYKERQQQLKQLAYFDELTGLPNRNMLERELRQAIARSKRQHHHLIVTFIDLDGFKEVNDRLGHNAGDEVLEVVANRLTHVVREDDLVARLGGDEFVIVLEETFKEDVEEIMTRIIDQISEPYECLGNDKVRVTPSIGLSVYPEDGEDIETLLKKADKAMYFAKGEGKATHKFYEEDLENQDEKIKNILFEKIKQTFSKITG